MLNAFLINIWACVARVAHENTHTNTHKLHTDKHILIGKINLLISLQLGVSIKYLVNKLPLPKLAIMYEPEGKWPICFGCVCAQGNLCGSVCLCNLSASVACVYLIHHLWGRRPFFVQISSLSQQKLFHFFNLFLSFFPLSSFGSEMSLQDVALVSWGLKPLRVTLLIICQIQGERCLAGCNVFFSSSFFLSRFVCFSQPLLACRCLSSFLLIWCISPICRLLALHPRFPSPPSILHVNSFAVGVTGSSDFNSTVAGGLNSDPVFFSF